MVVVCSNLCLFGGQWLCSAWSCGRITLLILGQWWCSAWPYGLESLTFGGQWWRVHGRGFELTFGGPVDRGVVHGHGFESLNFAVNGFVVHGRGFESLTFLCQWWCSSAWARVRILDCLVVNCDVMTILKISKANQTPRKPSRPPGLCIKWGVDWGITKWKLTTHRRWTTTEFTHRRWTTTEFLQYGVMGSNTMYLQGGISCIVKHCNLLRGGGH
jgi:hypothetical protein